MRRAIVPVIGVTLGGWGGVALAALESSGNTDGVLTWQIGTLAPGASAREVVVFAFGASHQEAGTVLDRCRRDFAEVPTIPTVPSGKPAEPVVWITNGVTDFALAGPGYFFWEGGRQSLTCPKGGQLSRIGYYIHYHDGATKRAGTPITDPGGLENLRVVEPIRGVNQGEAVGVVETADGRLRIRLRARMGSGAAAAMEFVLTNVSDRSLDAVRLSVYANLESGGHDHENDYASLDQRTEGLVTVDAGTGWAVVMAGLHRPGSGHAGTWASQEALQTPSGTPFEQWRPFAGLSRETMGRLARSSIPHPPAPHVEPAEPPTRTLSPQEAAAILERDWLFQTEGKPLAHRAVEEIRWALELATRLVANPKTPDLKDEWVELAGLLRRADSLKGKDPNGAEAKETYLAVRRVKRRVLFKNPVVDFTKVLFVDNPYPQGAEWPHEARHRNGMMAVPGGRLLLLEGLHPGGEVRKLAGPKPGSFWRADLSFDATRVLFCYKPHDEKAFHLYEVGVDGSGLRQITRGDYDDLDPIYLPDGRHVLFSTTRCNTYVRCMPYTYSYVLARCDLDGKNLYLISQNNEPDWLPTLLNDGRVIYSRWEYTDKALWRIQSLWTTNQDGTNTAAFWGNQSVWPDHLSEAQPIPNSPRILFTGLAHHDWFAGSIGMLDTRKGFNFPHGLTKVTCDVPWPECGEPPVDPHESPRYHTSGVYAAYKTPYPLSEEDFLVSARTGGREDQFKLYLMDVHGNRELIYEGAYNVWHAVPVRPRKRPPVHPDRVVWPGTGNDRKPAEPGILFSADVYEGVPDLPRGWVKRLRVLQIDAKTSSTWTRDGRFSGPCTSSLQDDGVKRILGTVPVEPDGSVSFKVPAGRALHFQLLDEHGRALQTMRSFTGVMPGERRGCVGCHEMHSVATPNRSGAALRRVPSDLVPPPWGPRSISYERMVQPVLDRYCGTCHQGQGEGRKKLDLTLRPGNAWFFKEPYLTLVGSGWMHTNTMGNKPGIAGAILCENFGLNDPNSYVTFRPMRHLSCTSKLIDIAMSGKHHGVKVDPVSLQQLIGWVDSNCPYRGEEDLRDIPDPTFAGVEWLPVRPRCKTAPVIDRP